jgi:DNA sulfur modification protein DndB
MSTNTQTRYKIQRTMAENFSYVFPAIRGVQAGREYYVSMCPLRLLAKLFVFDDEELVPELRAQRTLNKARVPDIARYVVQNPSNYTFSAITASIDGRVKFEPVGKDSAATYRMGTLTVAMDARFVINDGQHRRAAVAQALQSAPELGDETIAVVFFLDRGLERCQQMFSDLNRHAIKPSASLNLLYDYRSEAAKVAKHLGLTSEVFLNLIETERSSLSARSRKLFTLSAVHFAITELLTEQELGDFSEATKKCHEFWAMVGKHIPEWSFVKDSKMTAGDVRRDFIHSHAVVLQALGRVGRTVYEQTAVKPDTLLKKLHGIDWSRKNARTWEGRAMSGGRMSKSSQNVTLTCNEIKRVLGLPLTLEEANIEAAFHAARTPIKNTSEHVT